MYNLLHLLIRVVHRIEEIEGGDKSISDIFSKETHLRNLSVINIVHFFREEKLETSVSIPTK